MLTVTESNDVNTVLRYFLELPPSWGEVPAREDAEAAAARLADGAYKRLAAGLNGRRVAERFAEIRDGER